MATIEDQIDQFDQLCKKLSERTKAGKSISTRNMQRFRVLEKSISQGDESKVYSFRQAELYSGINRGNLHRYVQQGRLRRQDGAFLKADLDRLKKEPRPQVSRP